MITPLHRYWIWPRSSSRGADESLCFKTSGVDRGDVHWSSQERFLNTDEIYHPMRWIFENRKTLPLLVMRERIVPSLAQEPPLPPLSDGLHFLGNSEVVSGMAESLNLPVTGYAASNIPSSLMLLKRLTGANCFLFLHGACEAEASIGSERPDDQVTAEQALSFFLSVFPSPPDSALK